MKRVIKILGIIVISAVIAIGFVGCPEPDEKHTHEWDEWAVVTPATCMSEGEETRACILDSSHIEYRVLEIDPDAHIWEEEWDTDADTYIAPTCTTRGSGTRTCTRNGCDGVDSGEDNIPELGHDWDEWYVTEEATVTSAGEERRDCKRVDCNHFETEVIPIIPSYTVTFNSNSGSTVSPLTLVPRDTKIEKPQDPERNNHVFDGWFKEAGFVNKWDFDNDTVTAEIILYAKWLELYTVSFNANGGVPEPVNQIIKHGDKATAPPTMTKEGFNGVIWYREAGFTNRWNFDTDTVTSNITLFAKWVVVASSATDIADFGEGAVIDGVFTVSSSTEWNTARTTINNGGNDKNYIVNITADFSIGGSTANTFNPSGIIVSLRASGADNRNLTLSSIGNILRVNTNQTVIMRSVTFTGINTTNTGSTSLVYILGRLEMKGASRITGNRVYLFTNTASTSQLVREGGGIYVNNGTLIMQDSASVDNNRVQLVGSTGTSQNHLVGRGGGVYITGANAVFIMKNSAQVTNNFVTLTSNDSNSGNYTHSGSGGGISGTVVMQDNAVVSGNTISSNSANNNSPDRANLQGSGISGTVTMRDNAVVRGNAVNTNYTYIWTNGNFAGGGISGTLRISGGTVFGNNDPTTANRNTVRTGAEGASLAGTAEYGTFDSNGNWYPSGSIGGTGATTNSTIKVTNGVLESVALPNNANSATPLTENVWTNGNITTSGGEQWFSFTATENTQSIHFSSGTLTGVNVQLFGSHGFEVGARAGLSGSSSNLSRAVTSGQTYYIRVRSSTGTATGNYRIGFNKSSTLPPGTLFPPASSILLTENVWKDGSIPNSGEEQWFNFTTTADMQYIDFTPGTLASVSVQLYNSNGIDAGAVATLSSSTSNISRIVTSGQTYYIRVRSSSGSATGNYQIRFRTLPVIPLTSNTWTDGNIPTAGGEQWFRFTATASTQFIHFNTGTLYDVYVQLYDSNGIDIGVRTNLYGGNLSTSRTVTSGQTYYIRVWPYSSTLTGNYRIGFNTYSIPPGTIFPPTNATQLASNTWADGNIPTALVEQWFRFTATASTQFIHFIRGDTGLYVQLYDSNGIAVDAILQNPSKFSRTITSGQTYYIRVWRLSVTGTSSNYQIGFNSSDTPPAITLPESATQLTSNVWADGNIPTAGGEQWFRFTATTSTQFIHFNWVTLTPVYVQLYDINGVAVGARGYLNGSENTSITVTSGQTYYIRVWPYFSSSSGNYRIGFNTSSASPQ